MTRLKSRAVGLYKAWLGLTDYSHWLTMHPFAGGKYREGKSIIYFGLAHCCFSKSCNWPFVIQGEQLAHWKAQLSTFWWGGRGEEEKEQKKRAAHVLCTCLTPAFAPLLNHAPFFWHCMKKAMSCSIGENVDACNTPKFTNKGALPSLQTHCRRLYSAQ